MRGNRCRRIFDAQLLGRRLCITGKGGLARSFPHVPGVDFAGTVEASDDPRYRPCDRVVLTRLAGRSELLVGRLRDAREGQGRLAGAVAGGAFDPAGLRRSARLGLTSMMSVIALEKAGLPPLKGEVPGNGCGRRRRFGGGRTAGAARLFGRRRDGAAGNGWTTSGNSALETIVDRGELSEAGSKPLESERWGRPPTRSAARCWRACLPADEIWRRGRPRWALRPARRVPSFTVIPFLLRGVSLLGIDSVRRWPHDQRRADAGNRIAADLPMDKLEAMVVEHRLSDLPALAGKILEGKVKGRVVIDLNAGPVPTAGWLQQISWPPFTSSTWPVM